MQSIVSKGVNNMVHLYNILLKENEISCDYVPETSNKVGHVVVDTDSYDVKEIKFSDYEYGKKMYVSHVRSKLEELLKSENPLPKEVTVIWY